MSPERNDSSADTLPDCVKCGHKLYSHDKMTGGRLPRECAIAGCACPGYQYRVRCNCDAHTDGFCYALGHSKLCGCSKR